YGGGDIVGAEGQLAGDNREVVLGIVGGGVFALAPLDGGLLPGTATEVVAHDGIPLVGGEAAEIVPGRAAVMMEAHEVAGFMRRRLAVLIVGHGHVLGLHVAKAGFPEGADPAIGT